MASVALTNCTLPPYRDEHLSIEFEQQSCRVRRASHDVDP